MADKEMVTLYAVGDIGPKRECSERVFELSAPILRKGDIVFGQFERILSGREDFHYNRGLLLNPAEVGKVLANAGFNVISTAGNHHMDAGVGSFIDTLNVLKQNNILPVGVGMNLAEARTPAIIERKGVRVAFLGYSSILPKTEVSWEARPKRPGCAPIFINTFYEMTDWQPGTTPKIVTLADKEDLAAMEEDIRKAKAQADVVIMSIHWGVHHVPAVIAMYEYEVGHAAIDAGADLILGHHAHLLKGIEVYKGKVIFHCLGNFAMGTGGVEVVGTVKRFGVAAEFHDNLEQGWEKYSLPPDHRRSMIAKCLISGKKIERVSFLPCMINQEAQPEPLSRKDKRSDEVYQYVEWACKEVGMDTRFSREGDEVVVLT